jgi:dynactin 1
LRDALEKETKKPVAASSAAAEMIDFKKMFAETKAHSRAIDMELRQCEVEEARYKK